MAQTTPIAAGTTAANSADLTVTAAAPITVGLFATSNAPLPLYPCVVIYRKDPNGNYRDTGIALSRGNPDVLLNSPGIYRAARLDISGTALNPAGTAVGVVADT